MKKTILGTLIFTYHGKEVSVQAEQKIDLSKLRHYFFFPEKAESPYFTNLEKGGQKGGQEKVYFSLKLLVKMKKIEFELEF